MNFWIFSPLLVAFGSWFDHVKSWLNAEDKDHIMYISYEEMIMVRATTIKTTRTIPTLLKYTDYVNHCRNTR